MAATWGPHLEPSPEQWGVGVPKLLLLFVCINLMEIEHCPLIQENNQWRLWQGGGVGSPFWAAELSTIIISTLPFAEHLLCPKCFIHIILPL